MDLQERLQHGHSMSQFPVKTEMRKCTDVLCVIIGIAFTVVMIILAFCLFDQEHFIKSGFPTDSDGRTCGIDAVNYPYIYFAQLPSTDKRMCVSHCPSESDKALSCLPTSSTGCKFNDHSEWGVSYYPNIAEATGIGYYCMPDDEDAKQVLLDQAGITQRYEFIHSTGTMLISVLAAFALSVGYFFLVQCFPRQMNHLALIFGLIIMFFSVVFLIFYATGYPVGRWLLILLLVFFLVATTMGVIAMRPSLKFHAIFLSHSTKLVASNWRILVYIPIFMAILVLFLLMIIFEVRSFWSSAQMTTEQEELYPQLDGSTTTFWTVLVAIQLLWGLCFIKQAFNYCVSGMAVEWYYNGRQPSSLSISSHLCRAFFINIGSIIACSFMGAFFTIIDYIFDLLRPSSLQPPTCYRSFYKSVLKTCGDCFNLVRSDAMTFINMSGNPFCNAARYCEFVNYQFQITQNNQSISRGYRVCAHMLIAATASIINLFLQGDMTHLPILMTVFVLSLFVGTFWISLHADACESFQILFMMNWNFTKDRIGVDVASTGDKKMKVFRSIENPNDLHEQIKEQYLQHQKQ